MHDAYRAHPYLPQLAQFEWLLTLVFDAAEGTLLTLKDMGKIPPENWMDLRFQVHPSTHRADFSWNVVAIWQAITDHETDVLPMPNEQPVSWIAWRHDLVNQFCSLKVYEAAAIDAMIRGVTFSEICEGLCSYMPEEDVAMCAASLLKNWIAAGLISGVSQSRIK